MAAGNQNQLSLRFTETYTNTDSAMCSPTATSRSKPVRYGTYHGLYRFQSAAIQSQSERNIA